MSDYSVTSEDGFERTYDEDEVVEVRKGDLRAVLDVATMSMDFGSGFLDNEQVEALRKMAAIIGLDPMVATPSNFACTYNENGHVWRWQPKWGPLGSWFCDFCRKTIELPLDAPPDTGTVIPYVGTPIKAIDTPYALERQAEIVLHTPEETAAYLAALDEAGEDRDKIIDVLHRFGIPTSA